MSTEQTLWLGCLYKFRLNSTSSSYWSPIGCLQVDYLPRLDHPRFKTPEFEHCLRRKKFTKSVWPYAFHQTQVANRFFFEQFTHVNAFVMGHYPQQWAHFHPPLFFRYAMPVFCIKSFLFLKGFLNFSTELTLHPFRQSTGSQAWIQFSFFVHQEQPP